MEKLRAPTISAHGAVMPVIGYGTMELPQRPAELVAAAIAAGYRAIDTARKYGTEQFVGEGIRASKIARSELFVTTKVTEENAREADFMRSIETSLKTLGLDYVDLLLVHWPQPKVPFKETLGALAKAKRQGMTRHIGVSNFTLAMLDEAVSLCPEPLVTNQVEYHAYLPQDRMLAALKRHGMILTAYCPVARGQLLTDPVVIEIAKAHNKTPAQVSLRWLVQQPGVAAVPRALEERHIVENLDIFGFTLSDDEMRRLSALRKRQVRIADPPERAPKWDVETVA
ncbi:MAG TPA: aldo/keto reductase [Pseudolabrys sp.]|uniref:aldo/keto reductase n=1 Tax=Pseudolabrys sp. TaxID=1960880 RepID=UPI002DDCE77F|nr:aldo/keto reductase [Pseudolabrys sp.]HEV2631483.1 aldo/keto reductase [Pseudolabrys sp.]